MTNEAWPWTRSVGLHIIGDPRSSTRCLVLACEHEGGLWAIRSDRRRSSALWLNAGNVGLESTPQPAWSSKHAALYTAEQVVAIAMVIEDMLVKSIVVRLF